jgi:hypothetical protein
MICNICKKSFVSMGKVKENKGYSPREMRGAGNVID